MSLTMKRVTAKQSRNIQKNGTKAWHLKEPAKYQEFNYSKWLSKRLNRISNKGKK